MTEGPAWKNLLIFSIPMLFGNIVQQLYNTVDAIVVGNVLGDNALAAVGNSMPVLNLMIAIFIGVASGAGVMVSQYFGAKQKEDLSHTIGTSLTLITIVSLGIAVAFPPLVRPLLGLLDTPASILEDCAEYSTILLWGTIGLAYYNILSGILRGLGDSLSALVFLVIASLTNVVLDIWFVAYLEMGVAGAAYATIIAQGLSGLLCLWRLMKMRDILDFSPFYLKPKKKYVVQLLRLGLPTGISQAIFSVALVLVQSLTNSFGELVIAANIIVMRVDGFVMMPNFTFAAAMMTYAGQNVGAGKLDRLRSGFRDCLLMTVGTATVLVLVILIWGRNVMGLFTQTEELLDLGMRMMRILAVGYIAIGVTQVPMGVIRGAGDSMTPMWITMITNVVLRLPLAYAMVWYTRRDGSIGKPEALYVSMLICWIAGTFITMIAYRRGKWREKGLVKHET
jgi:putative MATE family efflux protein